jgi:hypothetical protein
LFQDIGLDAGSTLFDSRKSVGPFQHLQPLFYWACQRNQKGTRQSPCNFMLHPPDNPRDGSLLPGSALADASLTTALPTLFGASLSREVSWRWWAPVPSAA